MVILPLSLFQEGQLSVSGEKMCTSHACHKLLAEICDIRLIFRGDLTKFCEIFIKNHFQAHRNKFKAFILMY